MNPPRSKRGDFLFAIAIVAAALVVFAGTASLPPPRYEPIGSAAIPRIMGGILVFLSALLIFNVWRRPAAVPEQDRESRIATPLVPILSAGAIILYVAVMDFGWLGFRPATALLLFALAFGLTGFRRRAALPAAIFALVLSLGTFFVFTEFFYIDLPR